MKTVGSLCSGISAASVAWKDLPFKFKWFSEIAEFPSKVLDERYPDVENVGDMNTVPEKLLEGMIEAPDLICGGTPCQAFSLAGWKNGLNDDRGNLTLKFVDIVEKNDTLRKKQRLKQSIILWENVEGVLTDKTNAFGCFLSSLAGFDDVVDLSRWPNSGILKGPKRNIAWRILDAKFFGLPQQRRRLYVLAGGKDFYPENILFDQGYPDTTATIESELIFKKDGHEFEIFREYTDCLYSAYGTKWNGNAAAYNGSLFAVQNRRIRRLSPLECERLMGFPDQYTDIPGARRTPRYQAIGNSWPVPVIKWLGERILNYENSEVFLKNKDLEMVGALQHIEDQGIYVNLGSNEIHVSGNTTLNCSPAPSKIIPYDISTILDIDPPKQIYISPVGCAGILRRKEERNINMNSRLQEALATCAAQMSPKEIEQISKKQKRGRFSNIALKEKTDSNNAKKDKTKQLTLFDAI